ncbi:hypothetical protein ACWEQ8_27625 [Streptomyces noursei]
MTAAMGQDAEYHRAVQLGAARAIERLLKAPGTPRVVTWHIGETGTVRGQLLLPDRLLDTAIDAVDAVRRRYPDSTVSSRAAHGGAQELIVHLEFALWDIEFWAYTRYPCG